MLHLFSLVKFFLQTDLTDLFAVIKARGQFMTLSLLSDPDYQKKKKPLKKN